MQTSPDLLRELLQVFVNTLMSAQADAVCGAEFGAVSEDRVNRRNGYRHRELDTRAGTLDVAILKLREGTYFPDWLLERRKRAERALTSVVATCYVLGVSTPRMDKLVQSLGISGLSESQVSVMTKDLDGHAEQFRTRTLTDAGPFTFVAADALVLKVREGGRVVGVHALVATGVNGDGHRKILGLQVTTAEDGAGWLLSLAHKGGLAHRILQQPLAARRCRSPSDRAARPHIPGRHERAVQHCADPTRGVAADPRGCARRIGCRRGRQADSPLGSVTLGAGFTGG